MSAELVDIEGEPWRKFAACRDANPTLFFRDDESRNGQYTAALCYCNRCPVVQECLDDALRSENWLRFGMFGGMTPRQRHWEARRRGMPNKSRTWEF